ncbi:MAG: GNAT family N-acetyltransferase [Candidatus Sulfotelmatobacter sp.]
MRVRSANHADIPAMIALNDQSATAAHWSLQQYESLFADFDRPLSEHLILVAEDVSETPAATASGEHRILAFLVARRVAKEWELENIVVAAGSRRRGLGSRLLEDLIKQARTKDVTSIFLEVCQSNLGARAFYNNLGFVEFGSRKSYYSHPSEDAVLYRLSLSHNETAPQIWH